MDPAIFRWLCVASLTLNMSISGYYRRRARAHETIPRSAESLPMKLGRVGATLPLLAVLLTYIVAPQRLAWASMALPDWIRLSAAAVALATAGLVLWVLRSLGSNVSETVLTKPSHSLVTRGPYRWVRHPLYGVAVLQLAALSVVVSSWLLGALVVVTAVLVRTVIIPVEEDNLRRKFGHTYAEYRLRTGALFPRLGGPGRH